MALSHGGRLISLPDTHAHLDAPEFTDDLDAVLERALEAGVDRILAVGSDLSSSRKAISLAANNSQIYAAVGVHPHEADGFRQEAEQVRALLGEDKVVAVGEVGLDYERGPASRDMQLLAFREQLRWARERKMVVSVHNRGADADILSVLADEGVRGILHCFSGSWAFAKAALEAGHFLSFAGNLTFRNAGELRAVAARVPRERALVETDAPVLAPQPWRGRRNEPSHVVATAEQLADLHGVSLAELTESVSCNAERLFEWSAA